MKPLKKPDKKNRKNGSLRSPRVRTQDLEKTKEEIRELLASSNDTEARLSPKAKAMLEQIRALRRAIGPVPFKVNDLIREIREE